MNRLSHDLPGVTQRIAKLGDEFEYAAREVETVWKDEKAQAFLRQHASHVAPTLNQLVATLGETIELFESIAKQVQDPDSP